MKRLITSLLGAAVITAAPAAAWASCSASTTVFGDATQLPSSLWFYSFTVENGCRGNAQPFMTDFFLPYFPDAGIQNIMVPPPDDRTVNGTIAWTASIDPTENLFDLAGAGVIDFHVTVTPPIDVGNGQTVAGVGYYGANGFSFTSIYGGVEGPFLIEQIPYADGAYTGTTFVRGDPPIPGSPLTIAALDATATPEPATVALVATGLLVLAPAIKRRRLVR